MPEKMLTYKKTDQGDLKLHIFYPADHKVSDRRPAIVFFFGGGWNGGSPTQFYPHCEYLASRGMVAIPAGRAYLAEQNGFRQQPVSLGTPVQYGLISGRLSIAS